MTQEAAVSCLLVLLLVTTVSGQSDSLCPANSAMGLCTELSRTCFSDNDCFNGEICCPEACSRTCKPRHSARQPSEGSIPDLLNDPRVFVGKCPDASCYSMFGGDPNECSTSKLCSGGKYCCNDGCKNVCLWKPEYAALIAQEQARARQHQQMLIQKQQGEMRRRQQEMYVQRQRQLATFEQARKQAEARAAAESELIAQQKRASFEANLRAAALNQAKMASKQFEQTAAQLNTGKQQTSYQASLPPGPAGDFLSNFENKPQTNSTTMIINGSLVPQPIESTDISRSLTPMKKDNLPQSFSNHINSPASLNPHNFLSQQSVIKTEIQEPFPLSQSAGLASSPQASNSRAEAGSVSPLMTYPQSFPVTNLEKMNSLQQPSLLRTYPTNLPRNSPSSNAILNAYSGSPNSMANFANKYSPQQGQSNLYNTIQNQSPTQIRQQINSPTANNQSPILISQPRSLVSSNQNRSPVYPRQRRPIPYQDMRQRMSYISQTPGRVYQRQQQPVSYRVVGQRQQQQQQRQREGSAYRGAYPNDNMNTYLMFDMMQTAV